MKNSFEIEKGVKIRLSNYSACTLKVKYNDIDFFINFDLDYASNFEKVINIQVIEISKAYKAYVNSMNELFKIKNEEIKEEDISKKFIKKIKQLIKIELNKSIGATK